MYNMSFFLLWLKPCIFIILVGVGVDTQVDHEEDVDTELCPIEAPYCHASLNHSILHSNDLVFGISGRNKYSEY